MTTPGNPMLDLLPAFHRVRDTSGFLDALTRLIGEQFDLVAGDLDQLYDDLFVETCAPWVVPYLGDLVAVQPGATVDGVALSRAAVGGAIAARRRKGTVTALEQVALDLTGWPARAVEYFTLLQTTQNVRHVAPGRGRIADLRGAAALERAGGAFDTLAHRAEVRRIGSRRGRYLVPNVGVWVWRDFAVEHTWTEAVPHAADLRRFRFRPLGFDGPLLNRRTREIDISHTASSADLPIPITRRAMAAAPGDFYGPAVEVRRPGDAEPVPAADVVVSDLSDTADGSGDWSVVDRLPAGKVGIDPVLGRLAFPDALTGPPLVRFLSSAPADTGGSETTARVLTQAATVPVETGVTTLADGLTAAAGRGIVEIRDNRRHPAGPGTTVAADGELRIRAGDQLRPHVSLGGGWTVDVAEGGRLTIDGLLFSGGPLTVTGRPDLVRLRNCTLVPGHTLRADGSAAAPGQPSLVVNLAAGWQTTVVLDNCVSGPLDVPADGTTLTLRDSIVDAGGDGAAAVADRTGGLAGAGLFAERCTVIGTVRTAELDLVADCIVTGVLTAGRRQIGCVQYSWLHPDSVTPRVHRPAGGPAPRFRSRRYGSLGYLKLLRLGATPLIRGSSTGGELGAYAKNEQTQRDDNLRRGIAEFLRFSLEAGVLDGD